MRQQDAVDAAMADDADRLAGETSRGVRLALAVTHEIEGGRRAHTPRCSATALHPATRLIRSWASSRFHGWSKRKTRTPALASVFAMTTSSSQKASRRSSLARRALYSAELLGS